MGSSSRITFLLGCSAVCAFGTDNFLVGVQGTALKNLDSDGGLYYAVILGRWSIGPSCDVKVQAVHRFRDELGGLGSDWRILGIACYVTLNETEWCLHNFAGMELRGDLGAKVRFPDGSEGVVNREIVSRTTYVVIRTERLVVIFDRDGIKQIIGPSGKQWQFLSHHGTIERAWEVTPNGPTRLLAVSYNDCGLPESIGTKETIYVNWSVSRLNGVKILRDTHSIDAVTFSYSDNLVESIIEGGIRRESFEWKRARSAASRFRLPFERTVLLVGDLRYRYEYHVERIGAHATAIDRRTGERVDRNWK